MEPVIVTSRAALAEAVDQAVERKLSELLPELIRRGLMKPYLTKEELIELTGWSGRNVEYKKQKREIEYVRRGRTILFPTEAVFRYLEEGRVPVRAGHKQKNPRKPASKERVSL